MNITRQSPARSAPLPTNTQFPASASASPSISTSSTMDATAGIVPNRTGCTPPGRPRSGRAGERWQRQLRRTERLERKITARENLRDFKAGQSGQEDEP